HRGGRLPGRARSRSGRPQPTPDGAVDARRADAGSIGAGVVGRGTRAGRRRAALAAVGGTQTVPRGPGDPHGAHRRAGTLPDPPLDSVPRFEPGRRPSPPPIRRRRRSRSCWPPRSPPWAVSPAAANSRSPTRWPPPSTARRTRPCRPAPAPALGRAVTDDTPVVVSTATIALQRQLVERDLPRLVAALAPALGREPRYALLKGRRNYLCLNKIHAESADQAEPVDQDELFDP